MVNAGFGLVSSAAVVRTDGADPNRPALLLSSERSSESGDRSGESRRRDPPGSKEWLWNAVGNPPRAERASALCHQAVHNNSPARQEKHSDSSTGGDAGQAPSERSRGHHPDPKHAGGSGLTEDPPSEHATWPRRPRPPCSCPYVETYPFPDRGDRDCWDLLPAAAEFP